MRTIKCLLILLVLLLTSSSLINSMTPRLRIPMKIGRLLLSILIALAAPMLTTAQDGCNGVRTLAECPVTGCAERGSDGALFNQIKRRQVRQTRPVRLFFNDFKTLQRAADDSVGQDVTLSKSDRES